MGISLILVVKIAFCSESISINNHSLVNIQQHDENSCSIYMEINSSNSSSAPSKVNASTSDKGIQCLLGTKVLSDRKCKRSKSIKKYIKKYYHDSDDSSNSSSIDNKATRKLKQAEFEKS